MPTYEYDCPAHGPTEVHKALAVAGYPEACPRCGRAMRRLYSGQAFILRPTGYDLRPGDRGYADFGRALELGEVRRPDEASRLSAGATLTGKPVKEPLRFEEDKLKRFHDAARAAYNAETGRHEW